MPPTNQKRDLDALQSICPCGGGDYRQCCEPVHLGALAATPEVLMRSRYSAYVKNLEPYLRHSWHPSECPPALQLDANCVWLGLEIISSSISADKNTARVEFVARYRVQGGSAVRLSEQSEFVRFENRWVYLHG